MEIHKQSVAVVLPIFNEVDFVREALDSLVAQDGPSLEILVYDAGSTDGTLDILRSYPVEVCVERGIGQMSAINRGWMRTTAEFVTWMAGDDRLRRGALRRLVAALQEQPECAAVHADAAIIDEKGHQTGLLLPGHVQLRELVFEFTIIPQTCLIRRSALERAGMFDESRRLAADYDLFLRLAQYYPLQYLPFTAADYRVHAGSQDAQNRHAVAGAVIDVVGRFFERPDLTPEQRSWRKRGTAGAFLFAGAALSLAGDRRGAWGKWRQAVQSHAGAAFATRRGLGLLARLLSPVTIAPYGLRNLPRKFGSGLPRHTGPL